ncbi:hypothetical protein GOA59_29395 [Sinorhizobium meliloti]|uniref:hypothetical protein n=1 Tax=Rhizobium meliloti TaxID=382 RepID=UPI00129552B0|nr:hypothetical protein [Sinorhizobium meliloti]MDW9490165.1 hypothetical protein [Sinorhizobium meliloti]MDW9608979.1 hypothetical protein [Sinorhizobium meliloti]MDW9676811.1 hypothetical protein [Sinorhizobium meliloti]MDW9955691.1 hypothetical protein [Sinorhizobium meliloti]MDX0390438.1 hypothetical protein [Sinorhizobium meliloti]
MIKFIDPDHPFYRPLWIRLLIILFCAVWTAVEFYGGQVMWGTIFLVVTAYAGASLLVFYRTKEESQSKGETTGDTTDGTN